MLYNILESLAKAEPAEFAAVLAKYPHKIADSPQGFRNPKQLTNGYCVETHGSANAIYQFCQKVIATMNLPSDAWTVQIKSKS